MPDIFPPKLRNTPLNCNNMRFIQKQWRASPGKKYVMQYVNNKYLAICSKQFVPTVSNIRWLRLLPCQITICLLVSSADNLCKQFGSNTRFEKTSCLMAHVFLKEILNMFILKQTTADDEKHAKSLILFYIF